MTMPPQPPDVLGAFFGRQGRRVAPASRVSRRTREREIAGYQSAFPDTSREQARRATARMRQRGQVPTYTAQPTTEQAAQAQRFRQRSEQSREAARRRQAPTGGGGGIPYRWQFTPDGRIVEDPQLGLLIDTLDIQSLYELTDEKAGLFKNYLDVLRASNDPRDVKAAFAFNEINFRARYLGWSRESHILFLRESFEEFRARISAETRLAMEMFPNRADRPTNVNWYH